MTRTSRGISGETDAKRESESGHQSKYLVFADIARTADQVTKRLDSLIEEIHAFQAGNMHGEKHCDVVLVAHGHLLRAFVKRWLKYPMEFPLSMMLEPGAVGALRSVYLGIIPYSID